MAAQGPFDAIFAEQKAYYEARAPEYDEWWERRGRYDLGPEGNARWQAEIRGVEAVFDKLSWKGHVLEVAGGTGIWTGYLSTRADRVTVLDSSPNTLEINKRKIGALGKEGVVDWQIGDIFQFAPDKPYDAVFMSHFISHLPSPLLGSFFAQTATLLKKGGLLITLEGQLAGRKSPNQGTFRLEEEVELRTLNDGRQFRIIKRYDTPEGLKQRLEMAGFLAQVGMSGEQFLYAIAEKR